MMDKFAREICSKPQSGESETTAPLLEIMNFIQTDFYYCQELVIFEGRIFCYLISTIQVFGGAISLTYIDH